MSKKSFTSSTLTLFNAVLSNDQADPSKFEVIKGYGVIVAPNAIHELTAIRSYLKTAKVSGVQMNQTFYATPGEVEGKSEYERLADQLTHYFTTYGLKELGLMTDFMYIPHDWSTISLSEVSVKDQLKFPVIVGLTAQELTNRCFKMLGNGMALKQETIEAILEVLKGCGYEFTGNEEITNREAEVMIADLTGVLPNRGDALFRYIFFKASGLTMPIRNEPTYSALKVSGYALPNLSETQKIALSTSFNRRKEFWLAIKKANPQANSTLVNRISKLSKLYHMPMKSTVISQLTSRAFSEEDIKEAVEKASFSSIVSALGAIESYKKQSEYNFYRVRNGKSYVKPAVKSHRAPVQNPHAVRILKSAIASKIDQTKRVYIPEGVSYAIPTSEKNFIGNIPAYSTVVADASQAQLMVGVYWENGDRNHVDIDISSESIDGDRIGWNSRWHDSGSLTFSGDITNAPNGATEWFVVGEKLSQAYLLNLNVFSGDVSETNPLKIRVMVGYLPKSSQPCNYFMNPKDALFVSEIALTSRQVSFGVIEPVGDSTTLKKFTLVNTTTGKKRVPVNGTSIVALKAMMPAVSSRPLLNDFVNLTTAKEEADIDLSPSELTIDSLMNLIVV
jgi:hypothetical protein